MVTYTIRFEDSHEVGWNSLSALGRVDGAINTFEYDHPEPSQNGTFILVYEATVDEEWVEAFERALEDHPTLISYERYEDQ